MKIYSSMAAAVAMLARVASSAKAVMKEATVSLASVQLETLAAMEPVAAPAAKAAMEVAVAPAAKVERESAVILAKQLKVKCLLHAAEQNHKISFLKKFLS